MAYLALVRHGQSEWNKSGLWTGLTDIPLSLEGKEEAKKSGEVLKNIHFDIGFTSKLKRAKETLEIIKQVLSLSNLPVIEDAALNERDYGKLTGENKWKIKEKYGDEQFLEWRRSWDYPIPDGETLKDVYNRTVPYYKEKILPELINGKNIIVSAHGNSLRALIKYLEGISDEEIAKLEMATGEIYIYKINNKGDIVSKEKRLTRQNLA